MDIKEKAQEVVAKASGMAGEKSEKSKKQGLPTVYRLLLLIGGDALIFLLFAAIGRRSHSETDTLVQTALTALPFAAGWFIVAPWIGAFRRNIDVQPRTMSLRTALAWLAAWPVGLLFRGIAEQKVPPLSFAIVTLISNMILLEVWRTACAWIVARVRGR